MDKEKAQQIIKRVEDWGEKIKSTDKDIYRDSLVDYIIGYIEGVLDGLLCDYK